MKRALLFAFALIAGSVQAQGSTRTIYTPVYGDVKVTTYSPSYSSNNPYINSSVPLTLVEKNSRSHFYTVYFKKDSAQRKVEAKIDESGGKFFLSIDTKTESSAIIPKETMRIELRNDRGRLLQGVPTDSCWLFKIYAGDINVYSVLPEDDVLFVKYIQKGNGPMELFNQASLSAMIQPSSSVQHLIDKGDIHRALKKHMALNKKGKESQGEK